MEILGKDPVLGVRELPPAERSTRLRRVTGLGGRVAPVWCDRANQHPVPGADPFDRVADLGNNPHGLMTEREVRSRADPTRNGV